MVFGVVKKSCSQSVVEKQCKQADNNFGVVWCE
jgi:hypothetical protein